MRMTVVGAGVAGLTSALALAERGCAVEVIDRGPGLGAACCSLAAPAACSPPGASARVPRSRSSQLGQEALALVGGPASPARSAHGSLVLAPRRDAAELDRFARRTRRFERLDADGVAALEPALAGRFGQGALLPRRGASRPAGARWPRSRRGSASAVPIRFGIDGLQLRPRPSGRRLPWARRPRRARRSARREGRDAAPRAAQTSRSPGRCGCCIRASRSMSCRAARASSWSAPP